MHALNGLFFGAFLGLLGLGLWDLLREGQIHIQFTTFLKRHYLLPGGILEGLDDVGIASSLKISFG